ncbi:Membrane-Spanning 4-Domains Subfamily A Member 3 [Manis pentadactyla]|nr:Membrane-Spanning 4-Domains Subfamily A Member 3 [Manis pentadactyla]
MTSQQDKLKEKLLVFGAIEILSGTVILVLGVFLGSIQVIYNFFGDFSFFTFYTGYVIWGPVFGLMTLMLIFISLELCTAVSTVIKCQEEYLHYWPDYYMSF